LKLLRSLAIVSMRDIEARSRGGPFNIHDETGTAGMIMRANGDAQYLPKEAKLKMAGACVGPKKTFYEALLPKALPCLSLTNPRLNAT